MNYRQSAVSRSQYYIAESIKDNFSNQLPRVSFLPWMDVVKNVCSEKDFENSNVSKQNKILLREDLQGKVVNLSRASNDVLQGISSNAAAYCVSLENRDDEEVLFSGRRVPCLFEDGSLPLIVKGADLLVCIDFIEKYQGNLVSMLKSLIKVVKRGGRIHLITKNSTSFESINLLHSTGLIQPGPYNEHLQKLNDPEAGIVRFYSMFEVCMLLSRAGFVNIRVIFRGARSEMQLFGGLGAYLSSIVHVVAEKPVWGKLS